MTSFQTPPPDPDRRPIFVIGSGRSGTTLLRLMLNAHPRIYLTHEASLYLIASVIPPGLSARKWLQRYMGYASFAFLGLSRLEVQDELARHPGGRDRASACQAIMRAKARQFGRVRYGDKTPLHFAHLGRIFQDFPEARVIHIVRDPRATVASLLRMPWAASSVGLNSLLCRRCVEKVAAFADRVHELRLEDLLADPSGTMRSVLDYLGEPWDDAVLDHPANAPADDVPAFPWFANASRRPVPESGEPAWLREISPAWIRNIEQVNSECMRRFGYRPAELQPEPGRLERWRARLQDASEVWHSMQQLGRYARLSLWGKTPDPRELVATLLQRNPRAWTRYPGFVLPRIPTVE